MNAVLGAGSRLYASVRCAWASGSPWSRAARPCSSSDWVTRTSASCCCERVAPPQHAGGPCAVLPLLGGGSQLLAGLGAQLGAQRGCELEDAGVAVFGGLGEGAAQDAVEAGRKAVAERRRVGDEVAPVV